MLKHKDKKEINQKSKEKLNLFNKIKNKDKKEKVYYSFKEVVIIIFFSFGLGIFTCLSFVKLLTNGSFNLDKNVSKFLEAYNTILENYYEKVDEKKLIENAISGMVGSVGDSYTNYNDTKTTSDFLETVEGVYEGIGATISLNENKQVYIVDMFENSPSKKAGLEVNDIILSVDGKEYHDITELSNYVKNEASKKIKLVILRNGEEKNITVTRASVEVPSITKEVKEVNNKKIGYIDISVFSSVTDTQFSKALTELEKEKIEGLVIDVRGNGGGYLSVVTNITSSLLPKGKAIYKLEMDGKTNTVKDKTKQKRTYPIAVLINAGSASASEILAASIKESYKGFVVGTTSYGKGTVQQTTTLSDGSMIKYTIEKWLTPDGNWITDKGVEPTNVVELNNDYLSNPSEENDNQLQTALDLVSNK